MPIAILDSRAGKKNLLTKCFKVSQCDLTIPVSAGKRMKTFHPEQVDAEKRSPVPIFVLE